MSAFENDEQRAQLVESVKKYIERGYDASVRLASLRHGDGCDPTRWRELADMGWLSLPLPEACGGLGGSLEEVCLIAEELGRGLVTEPYVACAVMAAGFLARAAAPGQGTDWIEGAAAGEKRVAEGYQLRGRKSFVLGAPGADGLVVLAQLENEGGDASGLALFLIGADDKHVKVTPYGLYDGRHAADVDLGGVIVNAEMRLGAGDAPGLLQRIYGWAIVAHCAETIGAMATAFDVTLDYLKTRKQFGRVVASNQAIQHRLVDLYVAIEEARALTQAAALADAQADPGFDRLAAAAKAYVSQAARTMWKECVQLHGAIGMTDEYVLGNYVRRLAAADTLYGDEECHLERLAQFEEARGATKLEESLK